MADTVKQNKGAWQLSSDEPKLNKGAWQGTYDSAPPTVTIPVLIKHYKNQGQL